MADRIVVLNAGYIAQVGAPLELYHKPDNMFVAGFIGNPRMNFLPVTCTGSGAAGVSVEFNGKKLTVPVAPRPGIEGQTLTLGIRPEHIRVGAGEAAIEVTPSVVERLGQQTIAYAELVGQAGNFCMILPGGQALETDQAIAAGFDAADCHLFDGEGKALERRVDPRASLRPAQAGQGRVAG